MAGQNIYKGSNSNGVRSLSLPKWRESFVVSGVNDEVNNVKHSSLGLSPPPPQTNQQLLLCCFSGEAQERSDLPIYPGLCPIKTHLREIK